MKYGISLFASGGVGDLAMRANNIHMLVANELLSDRAKVYHLNYPDTEMIVGDINIKFDEIVSKTYKALSGKKLDVIFATPPCQGMSKNGRGKLLAETRLGHRGIYDARNQLIEPTIKIIKIFQPEYIIFENVPEMATTDILINNKCINILKFIEESLPDYCGKWEIVEFADYGVPQRRQRLITVFSKNIFLCELFKKNYSFLPPKTHSQSGAHATQPWVTLREAIGDVPPLDAKDKISSVDKNIKYHRVPVLNEDKYFWVKNTPEGKSAFDNQCPSCGFMGNKEHGCIRIHGINRSNKDTPIFCERCGSLLPRPWVKVNGTYRLMRGYTSAYKRMSWDSPASALTRNMSYACSDNKLHPNQNRVLSLYEAFIIHTLNCYDFIWEGKGIKTSDKTIREIIGESIPPKGLEYIITYLFKISKNKYYCSSNKEIHYEQLSLI